MAERKLYAVTSPHHCLNHNKVRFLVTWESRFSPHGFFTYLSSTSTHGCLSMDFLPTVMFPYQCCCYGHWGALSTPSNNAYKGIPLRINGWRGLGAKVDYLEGPHSTSQKHWRLCPLSSSHRKWPFSASTAMWKCIFHPQEYIPWSQAYNDSDTRHIWCDCLTSKRISGRKLLWRLISTTCCLTCCLQLHLNGGHRVTLLTDCCMWNNNSIL